MDRPLSELSQEVLDIVNPERIKSGLTPYTMKFLGWGKGEFCSRDMEKKIEALHAEAVYLKSQNEAKQKAAIRAMIQQKVKEQSLAKPVAKATPELRGLDKVKAAFASQLKIKKPLTPKIRNIL